MSLPHDVRYAMRSIGRTPIVGSVVALSLAMAIGINAVVFSWVQTVLLRPLPGVERSSSFNWLEPRSETGAYTGASWPEYEDLQRQVPSLRDLIAFRMVPLYLGEGGHVERTYGLLVSGNYFSGLGLQPAEGRFFRPDEAARAGSVPVVVISYEFWRTRFDGSASALGRTIRVNGRPLTIVGVAPERFQGTVLGLSFDLWVPATMAQVLLNGSRELEDRSSRGYLMMGRLEPRSTLAQARAEADAAMRALARAYPQANTPERGEVLTFWQSPRGPQRMMGGAVLLLQALMLLLLLVVCGNTANLFLARASARRQEMSIRLALGAGRWRIARLLIVEGLILAICGAALGVAFAFWGSGALATIPPVRGLPIRFQVGVDWMTVAFATLLGIVSALLFSALPVFQVARGGSDSATRVGSRIAGRSRIRHVLMGVQVGLAVVVLLAAGMFLRSFLETRREDPGFKRNGVLLAAYDLSGRDAGAASSRAFASDVLRRLREVPSVASAAIAVNVPLDIHGMPSRVFTLEGRARPDSGFDQALANTVTPGYFETMGLALRQGRDFADLDDRSAPPQVVVNETFVRTFVSRASPLGLRLSARGRTFRIVGVVQDSLYESFGEAPAPIIHFSYRDVPLGAGEVHLRARAGPEAALGPEIRRVVRDLDGELPLYNVRTLNEHIETNLVFRRIPARIFAVLGPLLLAVAAIGIYAVVAYGVSLRTPELGIRLALGATARRLIAQLVGETMAIVGAGAVVGWMLAFVVATRLARPGGLDPGVLAGVPVLLLLVAALACWLPARRVAKVDPVAALREP